MFLVFKELPKISTRHLQILARLELLHDPLNLPKLYGWQSNPATHAGDSWAAEVEKALRKEPRPEVSQGFSPRVVMRN